MAVTVAVELFLLTHAAVLVELLHFLGSITHVGLGRSCLSSL